MRRQPGTAREQERCLLSRRSLLDDQGVGALLVEAQRIDAVHDDSAGQVSAQRLQQLTMAIPGNSGNDDVAAPRTLGVPIPRTSRPISSAASCAFSACRPIVTASPAMANRSARPRP